MVVSLMILTVVTTIFIANYHSANKRTDLVMTAQGVVADIHAAQNNTLGLAKYNNMVPAGGWGVSFDKADNSYIVFADLDAPGTPGYLRFDASSEGNANYGARRIKLPNLITIDRISSGSSQYDTANATFLPPDPRTNILVGNGATTTVVDIRLKEGEGGTTKTVRINFLGLAEVID